MRNVSEPAAPSAVWQTELDQAVDRREDQLIAIRRRMHMQPEPSGEEYETSVYLQKALADEGFAPRLGPEGRGVIVDSPAPPSVDRVALRADIDALHIHDEKKVAYRSQCQGVMHACGHDAHSAIVVGALLALRDTAAAMPWPVDFRGILQPAEETCEGARAMVDAGAVEHVHSLFALHVDPSREVGTVAYRNGPLTSNCDTLKFTIVGRGGHAARPHEAVDPIVAAAKLINAIHVFVPRSADSHDPVVITIGEIHGGMAANVIPDEVHLRGTLRALDRDLRDRTIDQLNKLARGVAEMSGATVTLEIEGGAPSVINDRRLTSFIIDAAREVVGAEHVEKIKKPSMGSEDFAYYLDHVAGSMFRIGCASTGIGHAPLHTPDFDVDEHTLTIGAKILARAAVAACDPKAQDEAK